MGTEHLEIPDDLKIRYLERRRKDVPTFEEAVRTNDLTTIERMGHQIKGNAVSFGYPELEAIGRDIETAAHEEDIGELKKQFEIFKAWVAAQA